jgi:SAM-dependent methyltransferase
MEKHNGDDWERHWTRYAGWATLNPAQGLRHGAILDVLKNERLPIARLLDIGSGQGDFLARACAAHVADAYAGFELSAAGVNASHSKVPQAEFVELDIFAPSADANRFQGWATAAVCSDVIEHVDDPVVFLSSLRKYLGDKATLVLTVPGGPMSPFDRHIGHRRHFSRASVRQVLEEAGFAVSAVRLAGFPFFNLYRLMVIARGRQLIRDVEAPSTAPAKGVARLAMQAFALLFNFTLNDSPLGWQVVAIAHNSVALHRD